VPRQRHRRRGAAGKAAGAGATGLGVLAKVGVGAKLLLVVTKLKALTSLVTVLVSVAAYSFVFGWRFAVGFVALILVHELGHVVVLRARGIPASLPMFIPFFGAFVSMKAPPRSAYDEALSGIAGPVAGAAGAALVAYAGHLTGSPLLNALAYTGFLLNLFNLLPVLPLDGGRVAAALHPALWGVGLVGLLAYELYRPSPILPILLLLGGFEMFRRLRARRRGEDLLYYRLAPGQRPRIAVAYVLLVAALLWGMEATYVAATFR
jgi:Zn-dependent protease